MSESEKGEMVSVLVDSETINKFADFIEPFFLTGPGKDLELAEISGLLRSFTQEFESQNGIEYSHGGPIPTEHA